MAFRRALKDKMHEVDLLADRARGGSMSVDEVLKRYQMKLSRESQYNFKIKKAQAKAPLPVMASPKKGNRPRVETAEPSADGCRLMR